MLVGRNYKHATPKATAPPQGSLRASMLPGKI